MDDARLLRLCHQVVDAVEAALGELGDWQGAGERPGQYAVDLVADRAALSVLEPTGIGIVSEESGVQGAGTGLVAVVDPLDGSTNAARGLAWYASSVCIVDDAGPRAAVVANLANGVRYHAQRGQGAWCGEKRLRPSGCTDIHHAVVGLSGFPRRHLGWAQYRAFGAAALDMCAVAEGTLDAFSAVGFAHLGSWDYLGGMLVCTEAGAVVADLDGNDLLTLDHGARRAVAAAATPQLLDQLRRGVLDSRPAASGPSGR